jgi:hypothetical protein
VPAALRPGLAGQSGNQPRRAPARGLDGGPLVSQYGLVANVALIVEWVKFRRRGIHKNIWLWVITPVVGAIVLAIPIWGDLRPGQPSPYNVLPWLTIGLIAVGVIYALVLGAVRPQVLERAPALLEGDESLATDPLVTGG